MRARANQGCLVTPFILAGAMAPVTVAGTATQTLAEALAGMALVQQQFCPTASRLELIVDLRLREGASGDRSRGPGRACARFAAVRSVASPRGGRTRRQTTQ
jgi:multidrug efflux pump subunit AcrB